MAERCPCSDPFCDLVRPEGHHTPEPTTCPTCGSTSPVVQFTDYGVGKGGACSDPFHHTPGPTASNPAKHVAVAVPSCGCLTPGSCYGACQREPYDGWPNDNDELVFQPGRGYHRPEPASQGPRRFWLCRRRNIWHGDYGSYGPWQVERDAEFADRFKAEASDSPQVIEVVEASTYEQLEAERNKAEQWATGEVKERMAAEAERDEAQAAFEREYALVAKLRWKRDDAEKEIESLRAELRKAEKDRDLARGDCGEWWDENEALKAALAKAREGLGEIADKLDFEDAGRWGPDEVSEAADCREIAHDLLRENE